MSSAAGNMACINTLLAEVLFLHAGEAVDIFSQMELATNWAIRKQSILSL